MVYVFKTALWPHRCRCTISTCVIQIPMERFEPLHSLQILDLRGNSINNIGHGSFPSSLVKLNMRDNHIDDLDPEAFAGLANLTVLDLSLNGLNKIEKETFEALENVKYVHLADNDIEFIADDIFPNIRLIDVSRNKLRRFSKSILERVVSGDIKTFIAKGNPMHCNCELKQLQNMFRETPMSTIHFPNCHSPLGVRSRDFRSVKLACRKPSLPEISILLSKNKTTIQCAATGDPAPSIRIRTPSGHESMHKRLSSSMFASVAAHKLSHEESHFGEFVCLAENEAGLTKATYKRVRVTDTAANVVHENETAMKLVVIVCACGFGITLGILIVMAIVVCFRRVNRQRAASQQSSDHNMKTFSSEGTY